jgi:hypothetical protein
VGFQLPDEPDVSSFAYFLVAIPDDPIYRQAIKGWYSELGQPHMWGLEKVTSGSFVAAQAWLRAIDETWRLLEMGWPDLLLGYIDGVESLLAEIRDKETYALTCCNDNYTFAPIPGGGESTGDVPQPIIDAGYATGVSDHEGYNGYRCMAAHLFLDVIASNLQDLAPIVQGASFGLSLFLLFFGSVIHVPAVSIAGLLVGIPEILAFIDALKDLGSVTLNELADDLIANHEEIVCAIVQGDGIDDMIDQFDAAINDAFSFPGNVLIRSMNIRHMMQLFMYGEHGENNLADQLAAAGYDTDDYSCCDWDLLTYEEDFAANGGGWGSNTGNPYHAGQTSIHFRENDCYLDAGGFSDYADVGLTVGHKYKFRSVEYDGMHAVPVGPTNTYKLYLATSDEFAGLLHSERQTSEMGLNPTFTLVTPDVSDWPIFNLTGNTQRIMRLHEYNGIDCFAGRIKIVLEDHGEY